MAHAAIRPSDVARTVAAHPWRFIVPVIALTFLAFCYALVRSNTWEASQALVVRDEAGDRLTRPGKFAHADEMKTSQETLLELVKSRNVLSKALAAIGPPAGRDAAEWPNENDLEAVQGQVKITPPKGAEFGKTEVFYLKVQDTDPQRAVALTAAICRQLQDSFAQLREATARGTTGELTKSVSLAREDLAEATRALGTMEQMVGADLAELRILNESPSGDSDLRRTAIELEKELRVYQAAQIENEQFFKILQAAEHDADKLLAGPNVLFKSQPALGRLKDGLVDAQLRTGQVLGTMSKNHPLGRAALAAEQAIRAQLHDEIRIALRGVEADLHVSADHIRALEQQCATVQARLGRLAGLRAEYANLVTAAKSRGESLKTVEHDLAEARASQAAAGAASLINLVDAPDAGTRPIGPGRSTLVLAGFGGGCLIALAILFLSVAPTAPVPTLNSRLANVQAGRVAGRATPLNLRQALERVSRKAI